MLLRPDGQKAWDEQMDRVTPGRFAGRKLRSEVGYTPIEIENKEAQVPINAYKFADNLCVDCGSNSVRPMPGPDGKLRLNRGAWFVDKPMPAHELIPGDLILYVICHDCLGGELWNADFLRQGGGVDSGDYLEKVHQRRQDHIQEFLQLRLPGTRFLRGRH